MDILRILIGILVLTLGRKLFWLFVAVVGFAFGASLGSQFFQGQPDWVILIVALGAGLVGALLALFLQQVAIALAGFIGGGYIALYLVSALGWGTPGGSGWLPFLIGGVMGLVLMIALFDWALIVLSSLIGAGLIVQAIPLHRSVEGLLFIILLIVGIAVQASLMGRARSQPTPPADVRSKPSRLAARSVHTCRPSSSIRSSITRLSAQLAR